MQTVSQILSNLEAYRYSILVVIVVLVLLILYRKDLWGQCLVDNLNHVTTNVWAVLLISWGVILTVKGHDTAATPLLTGGFALLRGPGTPNANGKPADAPKQP